MGEDRKDRKSPINSPLNKVIISKEANLKIQRVTDYKDNKKLACKDNLIPMPTDEEYTKDPDLYDLNTFLSHRFDMIKENVANHLQRLKAE